MGCSCQSFRVDSRSLFIITLVTVLYHAGEETLFLPFSPVHLPPLFSLFSELVRPAVRLPVGGGGASFVSMQVLSAGREKIRPGPSDVE